MPDQLKKTVITPTLKSGSKGDAANYRPIALTSHLIKIFEKTLRNHLTNYMNQNNLFNPNQHGFRAGHSCLSELLDHYDSILNSLNENKNVDVIYLDFAKAFDKVDFNIVLQKIEKLGINGHTLDWIKSFLTNRTQKVVVNGTMSDTIQVISSVPQASVLGPLIFLILLEDIDYDVDHSQVRSFADDTRASHGIKSLQDLATLQSDLYKIYAWTETNNMKLHDNKFELLRYGKDDIIKDLTHYFSPSGSLITNKEIVKDLGVLMSSNNSFSAHIDNVIEKGKQLSSWIFRSFISRGQHEMLTLWKSLVLPKIEYCSVLWSPHKISEIQDLEHLQWSFIRRINGTAKLNYWQCLKKFKLYSLQRRRERYMIIYIWKIIECLVPNINNSISVVLNDRLGRKCKIRVHTNKLKSHQITGIGVSLFNMLPKNIRSISNKGVGTFKSALDKYLTMIPDEPHIIGYCGRRSNSNSLVDMIKTWNLESGRTYNCSS